MIPALAEMSPRDGTAHGQHHLAHARRLGAGGLRRLYRPAIDAKHSEVGSRIGPGKRGVEWFTLVSNLQRRPCGGVRDARSRSPPAAKPRRLRWNGRLHVPSRCCPERLPLFLLLAESPLQTPAFCTAVSMIFSLEDKIIVTLPRAAHIAQMARVMQKNLNGFAAAESDLLRLSRI